MDKTREIRELFEGSEDVVFSGQMIANGMLPEDLEVRYGDAGHVGIATVTSPKKIQGGEIITTKEMREMLPEGYEYDRTHKLASKRRHIIIQSDNVEIEGMTVKGTGIEDEYGRGTYSPSKYGEHAYSMESAHNVTLTDCNSEDVWGDGFYVGMKDLNSKGNKNIKILGGTTTRNGRQGGAIVEGENILIDGHTITGSPRSGIDIEINHPDHFVKNAVIRNCDIKCNLYPFAMGGKGTLDGVKFENNTYLSGRTAYCVSGGGGVKRKNIVFSGNRTDYLFGSPVAPYRFIGCENILIENEYRGLVANRSNKILYFSNVSGDIVIRNNDFPNAKYIFIRNIDPKQLKVYGNKQDLYYVVVPPNYEEDSYHDTSNAVKIEEYKGEVDTSWTDKITGLPEVVEPEIPDGEDSEEVPGFTEEDSEETPETEEVEKAWYHNKVLWIVAIAILIFLIALL
jgi:hypothetical protein